MAWLAALRSVGGMSDAMTSRSAAQADCQVLIVGAGPTGLMLAAQLLARGVATRIIDKGDGVILQSRAINVHACTLEILDQMGLAERFIDRGQAVRRLRFYSSGRSLLSLDLALNGSRYGYMLDIPQDCTERLLRARVSELGGEVEQGMELEGLDDKPGCVSARVRDRAGQASQITAEYVVGCDGAHSRVRHELGRARERRAGRACLPRPPGRLCRRSRTARGCARDRELPASDPRRGPAARRSRPGEGGRALAPGRRQVNRR